VVAVQLLATLVAGLASASGPRPEFEQYRAVQESLSRVPPRLRGEWLDRRGLTLPPWNAPLPTTSRDDSLGLRLVGKWGRGPSWEVTGSGNLVFLSLGSEVAVSDFAQSSSPVVLSETQASGLVAKAAVRDSFLYVGCTGGWSGIEVWNVQNPAEPVFRSRIPSMLSDFCIQDTFLYLVQNGYGPSDTFRVHSTADPQSLRQLGFCLDSGYAVAVTGNTVLIAGNSSIAVIDVSSPAAPQRSRATPARRALRRGHEQNQRWQTRAGEL
jgi:hypothetical protein